MTIGDVDGNKGKGWIPYAVEFWSKGRAKQFRNAFIKQGYRIGLQDDVRMSDLQLYVKNRNTTGWFHVGHGAAGVLWTDHRDTNGNKVGVTAFDLSSVKNHELSIVVLMVHEAGKGRWQNMVSKNGTYRASCNNIRPSLTDWDDIPRCPSGGCP